MGSAREFGLPRSDSPEERAMMDIQLYKQQGPGHTGLAIRVLWVTPISFGNDVDVNLLLSATW